MIKRRRVKTDFPYLAESIHLQTTHAQVECIDNQVDLDSFEGNIIYDIKQRAYFTCKENYTIAVETATIESQDSLTIKAADVIYIHCDELIINAPHGIIEIDANIININADEIVVTTPGGEINITDQLLMMKASNATIDINEAATNAKQSFLGGKPEAVKTKGGTESAEELAPEVEEDAAETTATKKETNQEDKLSKNLSNEDKIEALNSSSLKKSIQEKERKNEIGSEETIELKNSYSKSYESEGVCWKNRNKGELELEIKAKLSGTTARMALSRGLDRKVLKKELEDAVAKAVSDKTEMTLTKEGKLTLTTKMPTLNNYSFNVEVGIDPQTLLPYAGASVSYEFYKYELKTDKGNYEVTGTLTIKNTFTPFVTKGICEAIIPIAKGINDANAMAYDHKTDMAVIVVGGGMFGVGSSVLGTTAVGLGMLNYAATASANTVNSLMSRESMPYLNKDETVKVIFKGYALERLNHE